MRVRAAVVAATFAFALAFAFARSGVHAQNHDGVMSPELPEQVEWWLDSDLLKVPLVRPPRGATRVELRPATGEERRALAAAGKWGPHDLDGLLLLDLNRNGRADAFGCVGTHGFSGYCFVGSRHDDGWEVTKTDVNYTLGLTGSRTAAFDLGTGRYLMVAGLAQPSPGKHKNLVQIVRYDGTTFVTETVYEGR